ncbi:MAG: hypothetical protein IKX44_07550 [Prevotella sp.]|nr:hypothetical protein [Prevotella sp.]
MANQVVNITHDRFENSTNSESIHLRYDLKQGFLQYVYLQLWLHSTKEGGRDSLSIVAFVESEDWIFLRNGSLSLRLDDRENINIAAELVDSRVLDGHCVTEGVVYSINRNTLKKICDASVLEAKITGSRGNWELNLQDFLSVARIFYNQVYDNSKYTNEQFTVKRGCLGVIIASIIMTSTIGFLLL